MKALIQRTQVIETRGGMRQERAGDWRERAEQRVLKSEELSGIAHQNDRAVDELRLTRPQEKDGPHGLMAREQAFWNGGDKRQRGRISMCSNRGHQQPKQQAKPLEKKRNGLHTPHARDRFLTSQVKSSIKR